MITDYQNFIYWIENLPVQAPSELEKLSLLEKTRYLIKEHQLLPHIPIITVTGTNGKGSTVYALASLLIDAGYRVGCMTSPHLSHYSERFTINLQPVSEQALLKAVNLLHSQFPLNEFNFAYILFFIGLTLFKEVSLDILILEVGLGGRLDPSNAVDADMVILTQVALDHTHLLGNTREAIGFEKADLLRENQIFICGDNHPPESVLTKARELHCHSFFLNQQFGFFEMEHIWDLWLPDRMLCNLPKPLMHPASLACAITGFSLALQKLLTSAWIPSCTGMPNLATLQLPGRCQRVEYHGHEIILDVAHNPAAVQHLANYLKTLPANEHTFALFGAMQDKDIASMLNILSPIISTWYLTDLPGKRAASAPYIASQLNTSCKPFTSVDQAWQAILDVLPNGSRIVVFGSFLLVGHILQLLKNFHSAKR